MKDKCEVCDLQSELDATNRQVEILSDALAESRRERQWVGLSEEDKQHIEIMGGKSDVMLAEMVEAKLKEKNT
jgi:hypothetical protein